jgi:hypothetical protein
MSRLIKALKIFAAAWAIFVTLSFGIGAASVYLREGLVEMLRSFNPLDLTNAMIIAFSYAPALIAAVLADVLRPSDRE